MGRQTTLCASSGTNSFLPTCTGTGGVRLVWLLLLRSRLSGHCKATPAVLILFMKCVPY